MRLTVSVKPRAKKVGIVQTGERTFTVALKEPAAEGRANEAVVTAIAAHFGVARARVRIVSGLRARKKIVEVSE